MLADLAAAEGLDAAWTSVAADTRSCLILVDSTAGEATVVNEPGPRLSNEDWRRFRADVLEQAAVVRTVCVSGSLPAGVPPGELADLCRSLLDLGREPWVDASGSALEATLSVSGARLKINREEAQEVLGRSLEDVGACAAAARELMDRGMKAVVLTLGSQGAVLATPRGRWYAGVPPMRTASAVASGDSFLAGLVAASMSGLDPAEALAWGVAAGAANALAVGGARFSREQFESVLPRIEHRPIAD
jgi:1-phosphofructokinase family hexose kinase